MFEKSEAKRSRLFSLLNAILSCTVVFVVYSLLAGELFDDVESIALQKVINVMPYVLVVINFPFVFLVTRYGLNLLGRSIQRDKEVEVMFSLFKYIVLFILSITLYSWVTDSLNQLAVLLLVFCLGILVGLMIPEKYPNVCFWRKRESSAHRSER